MQGNERPKTGPYQRSLYQIMALIGLHGTVRVLIYSEHYLSASLCLSSRSQPHSHTQHLQQELMKKSESQQVVAPIPILNEKQGPIVGANVQRIDSTIHKRLQRAFSEKWWRQLSLSLFSLTAKPTSGSGRCSQLIQTTFFCSFFLGVSFLKF